MNIIKIIGKLIGAIIGMLIMIGFNELSPIKANDFIVGWISCLFSIYIGKGFEAGYNNVKTNK